MNRIRIATTIVALGLTLAGCSAAAEPSSSPSASVANTPVTLDDRPLEAQLADAVRAGDLATVEAAVEAGADIEADLGSGLRALHLAVLTSNPEVEAYLISAGADIEARDRVQETPLHKAAHQESAEVAQLLLDAGALTEVFATDRFGSAPIHYAALENHNLVLVALLDAGADVNARNVMVGATPAMAAAYAGNVEALEILWAYDADFGIINNEERTAHGIAFTFGQDEAAAWLEDHGFNR